MINMAERLKGFDELGKAFGITTADSTRHNAAASAGNREYSGQRSGADSRGFSNKAAAPGSGTTGFDNSNYVKKAESVIRSIGKPDSRNPNKYTFGLTTSKLRGILSLFNQIYNDVIANTSEKLDKTVQDKIKYLKVRIIYEAGRESDQKAKPVTEFVEKSGIIVEINNIGDSRSKFMDVLRYMEALVAYHRYLGGRD
jgi:CRISPR-associated protein Csm2